MPNESVSFPDWKVVLERADMSVAARAEYTREIITFLKYCKDHHAAATAELAGQYLAVREQQTRGPAREALRWFYRQGRDRSRRAVTATGEPLRQAA
jgi:hypothetical protein